MGDVSWRIEHFDRNGNAINANYSNYVAGEGTTNQILHATDRQLGFALNGIDTCSFAIYLDDPMAAQINRLTSFIKVWRTVPGYSDPDNQPCFAGIVGNHQKQGASNIMRVQAFNPFWRLQFRFHLLNHYLKTDPDTNDDYKTSGVIWRLIYFLSNAFGPSVSYMGIDKGTFYDLANEVTEAPYFQPKGANAWTEIFDGLLTQAATIDLIPRYFHANGNSRLMYLDTALKRGIDKSSSVTFSYRTATPSVLDDITESESAEPNTFANYVWAVGAGGPNSGRVAVAEDNSAIGLGYNSIGIYQKRTNYGDIKRLGKGPNVPGGPTDLRARALNDLERAIVPNTLYEVTLSPAANIYYGKDFSVGDVINLNASKGALQVSNVKQRIYEPTLSISDNNIESCSLRLSSDFFGKVAT